MDYKFSSIENFRAFALENWHTIFEATECLSKEEWDKRKRIEAGLPPEPTAFEKKINPNSRYRINDTFVFVMNKPTAFYTIEDAIRLNKHVTRIYYLVTDHNEAAGKKALYTINLEEGMYLIFLASNNSGLLEEIYVEVYYSFEEYSSSLCSAWTEISQLTSYSVRDLTNMCILSDIFATKNPL